MARISDIVRGLRIIARHCYQEKHLSGADKDIIYAPPVDRPLTSNAIDELLECGWHVDEEQDLWAHFC